jgi:hypothetical protein
MTTKCIATRDTEQEAIDDFRETLKFYLEEGFIELGSGIIASDRIDSIDHYSRLKATYSQELLICAR